MDLTEPEALPETAEQSGEYRERFRYQLWSQAAQDFRSRPPAPQRFASASSNRTTIGLNALAAEPRDASDSDSPSSADGARQPK